MTWNKNDKIKYSIWFKSVFFKVLYEVFFFFIIFIHICFWRKLNSIEVKNSKIRLKDLMGPKKILQDDRKGVSGALAYNIKTPTISYHNWTYKKTVTLHLSDLHVHVNSSTLKWSFLNEIKLNKVMEIHMPPWQQLHFYLKLAYRSDLTTISNK